MNTATQGQITLVLHGETRVCNYSTDPRDRSQDVWLPSGRYLAIRREIAYERCLLITHPDTNNRVGLPESVWRAYDNPHAGDKRVEIIESRKSRVRQNRRKRQLI